jgi:hypothetical protein
MVAAEMEEIADLIVGGEKTLCLLGPVRLSRVAGRKLAR